MTSLLLLRRCVVRTFGLTIALTMIGTVATAEPIALADFRYIETALDGGLFQYDYTLFNLTDPLNPDNAGLDAYDVLVTHESATFTFGLLPAGWDAIAGLQSARAFSTLPGPPPLGADVAPGASLAGFRFTTDMQVGNISFEITFSNPSDFDAPFVVQGVTSPQGVPEPGTLWLLGTGVFGGLCHLRRRTNR